MKLDEATIRSCVHCRVLIRFSRKVLCEGSLASCLGEGENVDLRTTDKGGCNNILVLVVFSSTYPVREAAFTGAHDTEDYGIG